MTHMDDILERVGKIQPLPDTVFKLINVVNDPDSTVNDILDSIRYDQAVTSQMLRMCNSAYFALSREVNSLNEAIRLLGTMKILQMVMAIHSNSLLAREQSGYGLDPGVLWRHSVGVAIASTMFAERLNIQNPNLCFTAGLLHDIGKVILNEYVSKEFVEIIRLVDEQKMAFTEAEQQVLGFSHDEIGARIAEKWQLPETIVNCIRHHHKPKSLTTPDRFVDAVYLANCICLLLGVGLGADHLFHRADEELMERNGLHESDLEMIGIKMLTELKRVEQVFSESPKPASTESLVAK